MVLPQLDKPVRRRVERRPDQTAGVRLAFDFGEPPPISVADAIRSEAALAKHNPIAGIVPVHGASVNGVTVRVDLGHIGPRARTLVDVLAACRLRGTPLPPALGMGITYRVAEIVGALHTAYADGAPRVHGHLHAGAVLLDGDGSVRLLGPGLPHLDAMLPPPPGGADFVMPAPEVGRAEPASIATDVYGLATITCQVLADTNGPVTRPLALLSDASPAMRDVLTGALDPDPQARYASVPALLEALIPADTSTAHGAITPDALRGLLEALHGLGPTAGPACLADAPQEPGDVLGPETLPEGQELLRPSGILGEDDDRTEIGPPRPPSAAPVPAPRGASTTPDPEPRRASEPRRSSGWAGVLGEPVPRAPSVVAEEISGEPPTDDSSIAQLTPATPIVMAATARPDALLEPNTLDAALRLIDPATPKLYADVIPTARSIGSVVGAGVLMLLTVAALGWAVRDRPGEAPTRERVERVEIHGDVDAGVRVKPNRKPRRHPLVQTPVSEASLARAEAAATAQAAEAAAKAAAVKPMRLLSVMSKPSGASVELNGGYIGRTPLVMKHEISGHEPVSLRVLADGYEPWTQSVQVDPSKGTLTVRAELKPKRTEYR